MARTVLEWMSTLPAVLALLAFLCGLWFAFRRHRKGVVKIKLPLIGEISSETLSVSLIVLSLPFLIYFLAGSGRLPGLIKGRPWAQSEQLSGG